MMPFIWSANWLLVFSFKTLINQSKNYGLAMIVSALGKFLFLFSSAFILVNLKFIPKIFLTTMGLMQFITAILGGVTAFFIKKAYKY